MNYIVVALLAYLLGSIPFGVLVARLFHLGDLRKIGSGNIGATNVLRTGNRLAAGLTLLFDAGKGAVAVLLARLLGGEALAGLAALCALLGHIFPVFLGFRGGKGVATMLGGLLALSWPVGLGACLAWAITAALGRISSLSALVATGLAPVLAVLFYHLHGAVLILLMTALVFYRHGANIRRLLSGTEPRIGQGRSKE